MIYCILLCIVGFAGVGGLGSAGVVWGIFGMCTPRISMLIALLFKNTAIVFIGLAG